MINNLKASIIKVPVKEQLSALINNGEVIEVRIIGTEKGVVSGYYDNLDKLEHDLYKYNGRHNIFFTMNELNGSFDSVDKNVLSNHSINTTKDKDISISERRRLASFPEFSVNNILNGTFFSNFDKYAVDQFVMRDYIRENKVRLDLALKNNYHDVYVYNDYLIKQEYPLNESSLRNLIDRINSISNKYLNNSKIYYSVVPDKNYFVNNGNLKMNYDLLISKMNSELSSFNYIDIMNSLSLEDYYYSDSHFKQENIVKVANVILDKMGNSYYKDINYNMQNVGVFKGVYSYQVPVKIKEDNINILSNEYIDNAIVYDNLNKIDINVYDKSKINSWDLYDIYLGGAKGLLTIYNNLASSDDELIVFRDSYGSSLVPLLIISYKKIIVIDTRYIYSNILDNYVEFKGQDVLFLYSVSTINNSFTVK